MTQDSASPPGILRIPLKEYPFLRGAFPGIQDSTLAFGWPAVEALGIARKWHTQAGHPTYVEDHLVPVVNLISALFQELGIPGTPLEVPGLGRTDNPDLDPTLRGILASVPRELFQVGAQRVLCAAALHDVFEDTPMDRENPESPEEVPASDPFWQGVYRLVEAVTDRPGRNRQVRHEATYPGIRAAGPDAVLVKLGDRGQNVARCWENRDARLFMYQREHPYFYVTLYHPQDPPPVQALWAHLNPLLGFDPDKDKRIPDHYRPSAWRSPHDG